ncbi:LysR family transcriptional regulator [Bordetella bronchialis]|uniref:Transcriptional regulator n=1 Tax=Bordetella bronchialis TaxID=463025 RepID=A0A193G2X1_9BORD|nr:LysR family transcriptional regulator [Bordetella bronchialis]ANN68428.1 transcriptional regulator [Bordetella bronchialis]ANN73569.1 transcriptional regulator [Bordetella bronchialis]
MRYDLTSLDLFTAVAEEKNLTRAARRKHLAVSAISKRIAELETQAGSPLLVRYARGVDLTPAGQSLLHYARQMQHTLALMEEELAGYAAGVKGHVRIHAITSALAQFLPGDIERFANDYPQIKFDIEERVGSAVVQAVIDGHADLGIFAEQTPAHGLQLFPYRQDELVAVVPASHPLAQRQKVRFDTLLDYEFVGPHLESSVHALLTAQAKKRGKPLRPRIRISGFDCMCKLVAAQLGIAILPRAVATPYLRGGKLRALTLAESWARRDLLIGVRSMETLPPTARSLVGYLRA